MIGKLDRRITIYDYTTARTATGGIKTDAKTEVLTDWCRLQPMNGSKRIERAQFGYDNPFEVTLVNRPETITTQMTAEIDGNPYQIEYVFITEDKKWIKMEVRK